MNQQILTAIIAASAALSGVIISQCITLLLSFFDKRHKKQILLRQKYEEMAFHFQDSLSYPTEVGNCKTADQLLKMPHNIPAMKAIVIATLYFPDLQPPLESWTRKNIAFYGYITDCFDPNIPVNASAQAAKKSDVNATAYQELYQAKDAVVAAIMANARKYTIA